MDAGFVEVYDALLSASTCVELIRRFEESGKAARGQTSSGVNTSVKDSWDITLGDDPAWLEARQLLNAAMLTALMRYARKYPQCIVAPLRLETPHPTTGKRTLLGAPEVDAGNYGYWHSEFYPKPDSDESLHRVLLWTIYLNDGFEGGETEFFFQ